MGHVGVGDDLSGGCSMSPLTPPPSPASAGSEPSAAKRLGYEAEQRILSYLRDGDIDKHDSLHSDVQRLYQEMLTWRILSQRWTPGGSEYMDPAFCAQFIQRERHAAALNKIELVRLRRAREALTPSPSPASAGGEGSGSSVAESGTPSGRPEAQRKSEGGQR
jgi:hypothetical protein